jgi:hypothetical protein
MSRLSTFAACESYLFGSRPFSRGFSLPKNKALRTR